MKLDHTIVPCANKRRSAEFYADILGLEYCGPLYHFEAVKVDADLTLLFDTSRQHGAHHYAFRTNRDEYAAILARIRNRQFPYGSSPRNRVDLKEYQNETEKGFYFDDLDGHVLEVITSSRVSE